MASSSRGFIFLSLFYSGLQVGVLRGKRSSLVRLVFNIADFGGIDTWFYIPDLSPDSWEMLAKLPNFFDFSFFVNKIKITAASWAGPEDLTRSYI